MIEIKHYKAREIVSDDLVELLRFKYGELKNFDYFSSDYQKAYSFCIDNDNITFYPIAFYKDGVMQAHISLIIDKRLPSSDALFGFFEAPDDSGVYNLIWDELIKEARTRGITNLRGPINGSIWHQYRCVKNSDGSDFFKSELLTERYYYDLLKQKNPTSEIEYYSGYGENFDYILQFGKSIHDSIMLSGFSINEMKPSSKKDMQAVADISREVFKNSWSYVELNQKEFSDLYSPEKLSSKSTKIYLLREKEQVIGFCGIIIEDEATIICKTIALLPDYHGSGLGNALVYRLHRDAIDSGIKKVIYALIRSGNNIQNFPKGDSLICRHYAAFEFNI